MNIAQLHQLFLKSAGVSTDTRNIKSGTLFFALKGDRFNGNEFADKAMSFGASFAVIDDANYKQNDRYIVVEDVLKCLQELARFHRRYLNLKIIAITGSNGKTTTKELIHSVLTQKYNTIATKGNLNNHIGVPLTLLSMTEDTALGIVEMGANHQNEIEFLCSIAEPDFGYITNFGKAHLEGFGGIEGVIKGKSELYDYLMAHNKFIFFNANDPIQNEKLLDYQSKMGFSFNNSENYTVRMLESEPFVKLAVENIKITSNLIGKYNFSNICAACLIGTYFEVPIDNIKLAIETYIPINNRSQILENGGNKIILDAYNANPTSMKAAIDSFAKSDSNNCIAILGDMYELGEDSGKEHKEIASYASSNLKGQVFLVGALFFDAAINKPNITYFKAFEDLQNHFSLETYSNTTFLVKASRGMALERILDYI